MSYEHRAMTDRRSALVTGAAGFIGSHVAEHCLKLGMSVTATDDLSGGFRENVPDGSEWVEGNLRDPGFVARLFERRRFDVVYHLAAYAAEGLSHFVRRHNYETNLVASTNLVNESVNHGVQCFVFTSSIAVYGRGQAPLTEATLPEPEDPYGISKYAVELDLRAARATFGLDHIVFRPHNVYGERQNVADRYRNVVGIFMNQVLAGRPMTIFGDGLQTRAFSHVDDVAPLIARAPLVPDALNQIFNVGTDVPHTVLQLAHEVAEAFGVEPNIEHLEPRNEIVHAVSDHTKLRGVFAPPPPVDLKTGLRRMAEWLEPRGAAKPAGFAKLEIEKNLPPSWRVGSEEW